MFDGEFKVMGMVFYGDVSKYDFFCFVKFENGELVINIDYVNVIGFCCYKEKGKGYYFLFKLIEWLGFKCEGDIVDDFYIYYVVSIQVLFEKFVLEMMDYYFGDIICEIGKVVFVGGCVLNVKFNQKIILCFEVKELFVQLVVSDVGIVVGVVVYVLYQCGVLVEKMEYVYFGLEYFNEDVIVVCVCYEVRLQWQKIDNCSWCIGRIFVDGNLVVWFQGCMEFGLCVFGGCFIFGCLSVLGVVDWINVQIKFCECWWFFCLLMLDIVGLQMFKIDYLVLFMIFIFEVNEEWKE